jgi:UDP-N-acetylmuramate--alanine ligase
MHLMAFAMAKTYGVSNDDIRKALASFKGIKKTFSFQIKKKNWFILMIMRIIQPKLMRCIKRFENCIQTKSAAAFQPHLFSRTKDFADGFAESLSAIRRSFLLDIYPARELPMEGVTSQWLLEK